MFIFVQYWILHLKYFFYTASKNIYNKNVIKKNSINTIKKREKDEEQEQEESKAKRKKKGYFVILLFSLIFEKLKKSIRHICRQILFKILFFHCSSKY